MGMCLENKGNFSIEVRRESFYVHHEDDSTNIHEGCSPEYDLSEIDDLIASLQEAREYLTQQGALPPTAGEKQ